MKFMKYLALFSIIFFAFQMNAQLNIGRNVIGSAGSESSNLSLQVSFTIGESFTSTLTNNEIHTLGFQQTGQSMVSIVELSDDPIELYPNPAKEQINFVSSIKSPFSYKITDVTGRVVLEGFNLEPNLKLDVSGLETGKYFFQYCHNSEKPHITTFLTIH